MKSIVGAAVTVVFCLSFGFPVSQNLIASSDLVVLSDSEMMKQTGGKKRHERVSDWVNEFKECWRYTVEDCPSGGVKVTYPRYTCIPCDYDYLAFKMEDAIKSGTSWCITTDVRENGEWVRKCVNRWKKHKKRWRSCSLRDGWCPSSTS